MTQQPPGERPFDWEYPQNEIGDVPTAIPQMADFSYLSWSAGSVVTLCNVPWNNDYRDIVRYASKAALNTYLDSGGRSGPRRVLSKMTYVKPGSPVMINVPFNSAYQYNYLRVFNPQQPVTARVTSAGGVESTVVEPASGQTLYYFILDVQYVAPNTTRLVVQLDVWQSFNHEVSFGNCYIERGHIGIANQDQFANWGRDYLTVPEGLDVGNEYQIVKTAKHVVAAPGEAGASGFSVMVVSTTSLVGPYGDVNNPVLTVASGSHFDGLPNGCDIYLFNSAEDFTNYMVAVKDVPWVTQGIVSVTAIPDAIVTGLGFGVGDTQLVDGIAGSPNFYRIISGSSSKASVWPDLTGTPAGPMYGNMHDTRFMVFSVANNALVPWRNSILPARYANLKKFLTSPYMVVELTTYSGNPLVLKPENMPGDDMKIIQKMYFGTPSPRMVFMPYKYNAALGAPVEYDEHGAIVNDGGEMFDMMTGIFNYPTFSVVNNGYMGYMAANKNNIAYQHSSADWSQERTREGARNSYDVSNRSADQSANLARIGGNVISASASLASSQNMMKSMQGAVNSGIGMAGAAVSRNPGGVVSGAQGIANAGVDYAINQNQIEGASSIAGSANSESAASSRQVAQQNADTNYNYARYAASGDYQNAIAGINARVQDAKMIQPTTAGQVGGDAFNLAMFRWGVFAKVKSLQPAVREAIGEYWLRYGYAINRFGVMPSDFQVMEKFTYWKLRETYIASSTCPELFRQTIRGIFEKGVTVWANADDIGMIDLADNDPRTGISL